MNIKWLTNFSDKRILTPYFFNGYKIQMALIMSLQSELRSNRCDRVHLGGVDYGAQVPGLTYIYFFFFYKSKIQTNQYDHSQTPLQIIRYFATESCKMKQYCPGTSYPTFAEILKYRFSCFRLLNSVRLSEANYVYYYLLLVIMSFNPS